MKTIHLALAYLNSNVRSKSRKYTQLKMAPYLCPNDDIPVETTKFLAKAQSYMIENVNINFQQDNKENLIYISCNKNKCNQPHLLVCPALIGKNSLHTSQTMKIFLMILI